MELKVPYSEKDEARRLGARWNPQRRRWYVPDGVDPLPFQRWWVTRAATLSLGLRASEAYLVSARAPCWKCVAPLTAIGFLLAPGFEAQDTWESDESGVTEGWSKYDDWAFAYFITTLAPAVARIATRASPHYRLAFSKATQSRYWANHCPACGALQGDSHLFREPGGAFRPRTIEEARSKRAIPLAVPFAAEADFAFDIDVASTIPGVGNTASDAGAQKTRVHPTVSVQPSLPQQGFFPRRRSWLSRLRSLMGGKTSRRSDQRRT